MTRIFGMLHVAPIKYSVFKTACVHSAREVLNNTRIDQMEYECELERNHTSKMYQGILLLLTWRKQAS